MCNAVVSLIYYQSGDSVTKRERRQSEIEAENLLDACLQERIKNRVYDRDFLLRFKDMFTEKPADLPDMEAIVGSDLSKAMANQGSGGNGGYGGGGGDGNKWQRGKNMGMLLVMHVCVLKPLFL